MKPTPGPIKAELERATEHYHNLESENGQILPYLDGRGISVDSSRKFRLGWTGWSALGIPPLPGDPENCMSIPNISAGGIVNLKFRQLDPEVKPKYTGRSLPARTFNTRAIVEAEDELHVSEGEVDCMILEQCGFHAIGFPGASTWQPRHARMLAGFSRIVVWGDGDEAGTKFARSISDCVNSALCVRLRPGQDVNDLYLQGGETAILEALNE